MFVAEEEAVILIRDLHIKFEKNVHPSVLHTVYIYIFGAKEEAVILVRYLHINFEKMYKIGPP